MAFKVSEDDGEAMADINIVPLVDVMLVLLVIFMVTAPLAINGIKVNLPQSAVKTQNIKEDPVVLSINKKGAYYIDKIPVKEKLLKGKLMGIFRDRQKKVLFIRADGAVSYAKVVDAMSAAKLAGVTKLSMLTQHRRGK